MKIERSSEKMKKVSNGNVSNITAKIETKENTGFLGFLDKASEMSHREQMKKLTDRILNQGEQLGKRVDVKDLRVYKMLISEFLNEVVTHAHQFTKNSKLDRRGRHKVFATVKKINEELDELTKEILESQESAIKILKRIQDIRGLVLDLQL